MGWSTFGRAERIRVPFPAARTITIRGACIRPLTPGQGGQIWKWTFTAIYAGECLLQCESHRKESRFLKAAPNNLNPEGQPLFIPAAGQAEHRVPRQGEPIGDRHPVNITLERLAIDLSGVPLILVEGRNRRRRRDQDRKSVG